jgi:hypothetical protein
LDTFDLKNFENASGTSFPEYSEPPLFTVVGSGVGSMSFAILFSFFLSF